MWPTIENYGEYDSGNYGAHTLIVRTNDIDVWYSYETIVAFRTAKHGMVISENVWGTTTGKHLNWINEDKSRRVPAYQFNDLLADAMRDLIPDPMDEIIRIATLIAKALIDSHREDEDETLEDYWFDFDKDWSLNVWWSKGDYKYVAEVWPIVDRELQTQSPIRLEL